MFQSIPFQHEAELQRAITLHNYSHCTFQNYKSHLRRLAEFSGVDVSLVTPEQCKDYLYHLVVIKKRSADTINMCRSAYLFFRNAILNDPVNPLFIPHFKPSHALPTILSTDEIEKLLDMVHPLKCRAILSLCYGSGLRISEAVNVRIHDIDSTKMRIFVKSGKGNKDRFTILSKHSLNLLRQCWRKYRPQGSIMFPGHNPEKPIPVQNVQQAFKEAVVSAKLSSYGKKITTHTLRHCFATHLLDAGTSLRSIQLLLGHKTISSTSIYLHLTEQHMSDIISPIDRKDGDSLGL
jgi:site-specific recombinase XerD